MKRKKFKSTLFIVAMLTAAIFASCSKEDNNNDRDNKPKGIQFSFTEEDYGADESLTRAGVTSKTETVDLGDCEAEVSLESEPAEKTQQTTTRAITNKHYTIRIYQGNVIKVEMKGTFNGSTFTTDAGSVGMVQLEPGTYDFVAFNDDVTASGDNLTVTEDKLHAARMAIQTIVITKEKDQLVSLQMKSVAARMRIQFVCQKDIPIITANIEATAPNVIPVSVIYNAATKTYSSVDGAMTAKPCSFPASTEPKYSASDYTSTSDYHYFLPTTAGSRLKLTFTSGTLFAKPLSGSIPKLSATLSMQAGKSYLVKIKLKSKPIYLFSDGTTGSFSEEVHGGGSKIAIGVVVDKDKRVAIALKDANGGNPCQWTSNSNYYNTQVNTNMKSDSWGMLSLENGYYETWDAGASTGPAAGIIKGNSADFPAFKSCGDYDPGVPLTGSISGKKWYLPDYGEWTYAFSAFGGNGDRVVPYYSNPWYGNLSPLLFTQVGGDSLLNKSYCSASEVYDNVGVVLFRPQYVSFGINAKYVTKYVRAFIAY